MLRLVRDSGKVLNMGRPEREPQWQANEIEIFCLPSFVEDCKLI
jgi:hypothetical protein